MARLTCFTNPRSSRRTRSPRAINDRGSIKLVNSGKSLFSENFPQLWLFAMGGLFILVVVLMPNGLAGLWKDYAMGWLAGAKKRLLERPPVPTPDAARQAP